MNDSPLSVIVLTHNRRDELRRTLDHLLALPERPPVIVVDNASSDGTEALVRARYPGVVLVRSARNLGAAARNGGVAQATTPYVAFCDDDTWWAPGALARAVRHLEAHPRIGALAARVLVGPQAGQMRPATRPWPAALCRARACPARG